MKIGGWLTLDTFPAFFPMIITSVGIGITRQVWWQYSIGLRRPLGLASIQLVCCPFVMIVTGFLILLLALVIHAIRSHHSVLPLMTLVLGVFFSFQVPLSDKPDTPEKVYFLEHRADYEATVELVRKNRVVQGECSIGYLPPRAFPHVSSAGCMDVQRDTERGLMIFFYPLEPFYHLVAYIEFDNVKLPCGRNPSYEPFVEQKIEDHWYVCRHEWN